ncbi:MAG TPA: 2-keto-4-pentenoate hydratase [Caulobacteraceae bacterium]|nr:2-keto-4-pentenoate hydratase [Caulobacteraceae bacterium]
MNSPTPAVEAAFDAQAVAKVMVEARLGSRALAGFPGSLPPNLTEAYSAQDAAIDLFPDTVVGWKSGRIPEPLQAELGADRVAGPVFSQTVWRPGSEPTRLPVIERGFAAVEAEYIYIMGEDAPADRTQWTAGDALALVEDQLVGVEFAGCPLAEINRLGPKAVVCAFGNNAGLILGVAIPEWRERIDDTPGCEVLIDGVSVGRGAPSAIPGGPAASLAFLLGICAARGRPLKRGQLISTGAASGIHDIRAGQMARIAFDGLDEIRCLAVRAGA